MRRSENVNQVIEQYNINSEVAGINDDTDRVISILFNDLYSDTKCSVIRELGSNALDAHVAAGIEYTQWFLNLPTEDDPILTIRDYGKGLPIEDLDKYIMSCGNSNKTNTNKQIGGFGFGSLNCLVNGGQAIITNVHQGIKTCYRFYVIDDMRRVDHLYTEYVSHDTPSGLMYEIPVDDANHQDWEKAAIKALAFFKIKPIGYPSFNIEKYIDVNGDNYKIMNSSFGYLEYGFYNKLVVCGGVNYPIDMHQLNGGFNQLNYINFVIEAPIGSINPNPNRETLKYDDLTKKTLNLLIENMISKIKSKFKDEINSKPDYFSAVKYYKNISNDLIKFVDNHNFYKGKPFLEISFPESFSITKKCSKYLNLYNLEKFLFIDSDAKNKNVRRKLEKMTDEYNYIIIRYHQKNYVDVIEFLEFYEIPDINIITLDDIEIDKSEISLKTNKETFLDKINTLDEDLLLYGNIIIFKYDNDSDYVENESILIPLNRSKINSCNLKKLKYLSMIARYTNTKIPSIFTINSSLLPKNKKKIRTIESFINEWESNNPDKIIIEYQESPQDKFSENLLTLSDEALMFFDIPLSIKNFDKSKLKNYADSSMGKFKFIKSSFDINHIVENLEKNHKYLDYVSRWDKIEFMKELYNKHGKGSINE